MSSQSQPKLVSKSPDFISIDRTVVANIDETYHRVIDAALLLEAREDLCSNDLDDSGTLTRVALEKLNGSLNEFHEIFAAIGNPGRR